MTLSPSRMDAEVSEAHANSAYLVVGDSTFIHGTRGAHWAPAEDRAAVSDLARRDR
jgi:hypothetical protein